MDSVGWGYDMDANGLRGMAVVTLADAERLGRVHDVLFEADPLRASALVLRHENQERVIPFSAISELGNDAIVTEQRPGMDDRGRDVADRWGLDELAKLKVVDQAGTYVGHVARVGIDPTTGDVADIDVRKGEILGVGGETQTLDRDSVIGVGRDLLTVRR
jgi:sporulation protein YlmC with PRC-barrel domain